LQTPSSAEPPQKKPPAKTFFDRRELSLILSTYGRGVAQGDWRDYAMDALSDRARFSIFRRHSEAPLYQIEKKPDLARKQGAWSIVSQQGIILKRGRELSQVLQFFDRKRFAVVGD
jgi:hypothetical protein